jgi:hypothetical protein
MVNFIKEQNINNQMSLEQLEDLLCPNCLK